MERFYLCVCQLCELPASICLSDWFWFLWRNSPFLLHLHQTNPLNSQQRAAALLLALPLEVCAKKRKFERTDVSPKTVGSFIYLWKKCFFFIVTMTWLSSFQRCLECIRASAYMWAFTSSRAAFLRSIDSQALTFWRRWLEKMNLAIKARSSWDPLSNWHLFLEWNLRSNLLEQTFYSLLHCHMLLKLFLFHGS